MNISGPVVNLDIRPERKKFGIVLFWFLDLSDESDIRMLKELYLEKYGNFDFELNYSDNKR